MAALRVLLVARADFVAGPPQVRVFAQEVETLVELKEVMISLISTPFTFRVKCNRSKISFGLPGKLEVWHYRFSLSSS